MYARKLDWRAILLALLVGSACQITAVARGRADDALVSTSSRGGEPSGYREAIARAIEEYDLGHFSEAREHFARAHALYPNARTLRGLGVADFELRRYVAALDWLQRALAEDEKRLEGSLRRETQALLERAQGYVGRLNLRAKPVAPSITIDGIVAKHRPGEALSLEVGDHVIEFQAPGYVSQRRAVQIKGGQSQALEVELAPLEAPRASPALRGVANLPNAAERTERAPVYKRWWLWTSIGVVAAGAAVATAVMLTRDQPREYVPLVTPNTPDGVSLQPLVGR